MFLHWVDLPSSTIFPIIIWFYMGTASLSKKRKRENCKLRALDISSMSPWAPYFRISVCLKYCHDDDVVDLQKYYPPPNHIWNGHWLGFPLNWFSWWCPAYECSVLLKDQVFECFLRAVSCSSSHFWSFQYLIFHVSNKCSNGKNCRWKSMLSETIFKW